MKAPKKILAICTLLIISGCTTKTQSVSGEEVLSAWGDAPKTRIIEFVETVTDPASPDFIDPKDRIATFDNDGTLWAEQPMYFQLFFAMDRVRDLAPDHPGWKNEQPYKAVIENDMATLSTFGLSEIAKLVMTSHAGTTPEEFEEIVQGWIKTAKHPELDQPFTELVYLPMLELMDYLRANDFKVFIVSGGGIEFIRAFSEEVYGVPKNQVVGSSIKTEFVLDDGVADVMRLPEMDFIDDKEGKPVGIAKHLGRRPVISVGNSDGDLQMMQYAASGEGKRMMIYLHHTDAEREWAYDRDSHIGHFDTGLDEATEKGWLIIDMAEDFKTVFKFQETQN